MSAVDACPGSMDASSRAARQGPGGGQAGLSEGGGVSVWGRKIQKESIA